MTSCGTIGSAFVSLVDAVDAFCGTANRAVLAVVPLLSVVAAAALLTLTVCDTDHTPALLVPKTIQ